MLETCSPQTINTTPKTLRIVMVAHGDKLGGMERHVVMLSQALCARGHQVAYAGPVHGWLGEQMKALGLECCSIPLNGMYDFYSVYKLRRFVKKFGATLLHGHSQRGGRYAALIGRQLHISAVATAHSTTTGRWFAKDAGLQIIAVSDAVKNALVAGGNNPQNVRTIHLGIPDLSVVLSPSLDEISLGRPMRMGMVARVLHVKGQDIAIRALAQIKDQLPAQLFIVGDHSTDWGREHKQVAAQLGIAEQVKFLGQRDDIAQLLSSFDVVLSPSRREALSLSLIEAAAASRAVIASNVGGISEVVQDGKTGILIPSEDVAAMGSAMLKMADAPTRVNYGLTARRYYEQEFTIDIMCQRTLDAYRQLLAAEC